MHDWQHMGERIELLVSEGTLECPTKCGAKETKLHYLHCKELGVTTGCRKLMSTMMNQLKCINTYPGIIIAISKILNSENEGEWWKSE